MKTKTASKILDFIRKKGKARPYELVRFLGISQVALHKQLRGLVKKGLLVKQGTNPRVYYLSSHQDIHKIIKISKPILQKYHVKRAALFGSVVRGDATPTSDIDILIDPPPRFSLFDLAGLKVDLEDILERTVDVIEYESIKPLIKDSILKYEIPSFNSKKNYVVYISDIIDSIEHIEAYCAGVNEADFSRNTLLQDAVIRRFQIIGEAAGKIPDELSKSFSNIPWKKIVAQQNLIIHNYATVRFEEVWMVIQKDFPVLKPQLIEVKEYIQKHPPA